jgi:hypothetical protein
MIDKSKQEVKSMKKYIEPAMDVQKFELEDIVTTSPEREEGETERG